MLRRQFQKPLLALSKRSSDNKTLLSASTIYLIGKNTNDFDGMIVLFGEHVQSCDFVEAQSLLLQVMTVVDQKFVPQNCQWGS